MSIIKCKMCGGDIELSADKTYGNCDSCGSTMTLPKVDDEQRVNLFNRANHFRRQNEFDKAISAYERILDEDNTNAEAHWGVVLSRFGIEYVEDPVTHERIPTCHRVQVASILTDADYLAAIEYAPDRFSCSLYETEAKRIAEIQKGILTISAQEEPYDVFICYKESTDGGSRTKDSALAQDIYYQLQQEGFKVFFARITLEDKLGQQYEPYIFAALNSAKVMLVVGTKPEYFNAVWVKNEWSRYLALMKQDRSRMLIPCYRDMDAYDLPEELSMLQSQDMSKIGFMQDLIRGVKKVLHTEESSKMVSNAVIPAVGVVAPLLKRAFMFLEDGDFQTAEEYCEKVLDMDPENAEAYLGKLMAELHVTKREQLANLPETFDNHGNYQKAARFSKSIKEELQRYTLHINNRNEHALIVSVYEEAKQKMDLATCEDEYTMAAILFESIIQYEDSKLLEQECLAKVEEYRKEETYSAAVQKMNSGLSSKCEEALKLFESIPGWKDADALAVECANKVEELREKEIADKREKERLERMLREQAKRNRIIAVVVAAIVCIAVVFVVVQNNVIIPRQEYSKAEALLEAGKYGEALSIFISIRSYKDSTARVEQISSEHWLDIIREKEVGDYITLGKYEQDGNTPNGKEDIEWLVLSKKNDRMLVISKYGLDRKPFNSKWRPVSWTGCTLYEWLNGYFFNNAFSDVEKSRCTKPVFLLSKEEASLYFDSDVARRCTPTAYAGGGSDEWWLRSPGSESDEYAAYVKYGRIDINGTINANASVLVRPAMWIYLK